MLEAVRVHAIEVGMHEASSVERAIGNVVTTWPADRAAGHLELRIRDATRAEPMAVSFYATAVLRDLGLDDVAFEVVVDRMRCQVCGAASVPTPAHPVCEDCGLPLRGLDGPAITCEDADPGTSGTPATYPGSA